jgi:hypothetical protein
VARGFYRKYFGIHYTPFALIVFRKNIYLTLSESISVFVMPYDLYQPFRKRDILTDIIGKYFGIRYAV